MLSIVTLAFAATVAAQPEGAGDGATRIATWRGDAKGAFMLMFDDCCISHVTNVFPALKKANMVGTFYVVPEKGERKARATFWEEEAPKEPFMVYANHTVTHKGFTDAAHAEQEMVDCNAFIVKAMPGKSPRLISFAAPGGVKHQISHEEVAQIAAKHNLVVRPPFAGHGAGVHFKKADELLKLADKAIATGKAEYVIFHGVGGDWISFDLNEFHTLIDGLATRRGELWLTDPISVHQYEKERAAATVAVKEAGAARIVLELTCRENAVLYDLPLTLVTAVPAAWKRCTVEQGGKSVVAEVKAGHVTYDAAPNGTPVTLTPAK